MIYRIVAAAALAFSAIANAQSHFPTRPVTLTVGFAPGGGTDTAARIVAKKLSEAIGQPVVVENRAGAGGNIAAQQIATAAPDGYTIHLTSVGPMTVAPHMTKNLPYDPKRDIAPITMGVIFPNVFVVHPGVPAKTLAQFVALAKQKPGEINYGTFGSGSSGHLNIELLTGMTGARFTAVHYKGAAPALTDVIGGHIQMLIVSIGLVTQPWQAGQLRVLGFGSTARLPQFPDVPTIAETLPGYEAASWYGLAAPAGTPREIVDKLGVETQRIFGEPAFRDKFLAPNMIFSIAGPPDEFAARIRADYAKWGKVIRDAHVKVE